MITIPIITVDSTPIYGSENPVSSNGVVSALAEAIDTLNIPGALKWQTDEIATFDDLPVLTADDTGNLYQVQDTGILYLWNGEDWIKINGVTDLSNYYNKSQINDLLQSINTAVSNEASARANEDNLLQGAIDTLDTTLSQEISDEETARITSDAETLQAAKEYADSVTGGAFQPDWDKPEHVVVDPTFWPAGTISNNTEYLSGSKYTIQKSGFYFVRFDTTLSTSFGGRLVSDLLINDSTAASNFYQAFNDPTGNQDTRLNFPIVSAEEGDVLQIQTTIAGGVQVTIDSNSRADIIYYPPKATIIPSEDGVSQSELEAAIQSAKDYADSVSGGSILPDYTRIDYTNHISTNGGTWTVTDTGFVTCEIQVVNNGAGLIKVNGAIVANGGANNNNRVCDIIPVTKGDVVSLSTDITSGFYSCYCYFIPPRAVVVPAADFVTRDEMMWEIAIPNVASHSSSWYTQALIDGTLENNDFIYLEDGRDPITGEVGVPLIVRTNEDPVALATQADIDVVMGKIDDIGTIPPQMRARSISWTDGLTISYTYGGDTTTSVYIRYGANSDYGTHPTMSAVYIAGGDQTMYIGSLDQTYVDNAQNGFAIEVCSTPDFQQGTRLWYENLLPPDTVTQEEFNTTITELSDTKADKYILGPKLLTTLVDGQDVGGMFINFDIPDFAFSEDADGGYATYDAITFSDGSRIRFENSSWYYMAAQVGVSLPEIIHTIVEGGNYWTDNSFILPEGLTITGIDPRWYDSPMSKGHIQADASDTTNTVVDCEYNYNALLDHAENDKGYWATLLEVQNKNSANQALLTQQQAAINDLIVRVSTLENNPTPAPPSYDMANPTVLKTPPLLGLLGLEIGGTNIIGSGWTAPSDGLIVIDGASSIGLLTPTWIAKNGEKLDPSNPLAVLTLIGGGSSGQFTVVAGDVITESGMGNVTFYPEMVA